MAFLIRLAHSAGLDKAVSVTLLARFWTMAGGLGTLYFVTRYLTPELQGYYYTFSSLIALQVFVELGLNYAIIQFASHEMAQLEWGSNGTLTGKRLAKRRLQSLMQFAFTWFGVAAFLVLVVLVPAGIFFFKTTAPANTQIQPEWAWILVVFFAAIVLLVNAALAILEGCNKVVEVAMIRFAQMLASTLVVWVALTSNLGLYALAVGSCATATVGAVALCCYYRHFFGDLWWFNTNSPGINWKEEIWPFQWRIAVSWASGYLIFQLFTPLLFATHGPVAAGQMGMSLQIISAMNSFAMVWITTKAPLFGQLVAQSNRTELDATFMVVVLQSFSVLLVSVVAIVASLLWLQASYPSYAIRVLPPIYFGVLCLVCLANHIVFAEAAYLRAHKEEPFMALSVANGLATTMLAALLIPTFGSGGAVASYSFGAILISLFGGTVIFFRKRANWSTGSMQIPR